jgi:hypothetical protein
MSEQQQAIEGLTAASCSRLRCGHYANGKGARMDIERVVMPGYPDYDGGLPGVSVKWGKKSWFVPARNAEEFWSQFPYEILRDHFISENAEAT